MIKKNQPPALVSQRSIAPILKKKTVRKMDAFGAKSSNTKRAYLADISLFASWMIDQELELDQDGKTIHLNEVEMGAIFNQHEVSPEVIIVWLQEHGFKYKLSTIKRKMSALNWLLKIMKLPVSSAYPEVKETLKILAKLHQDYISYSLTKAGVQEQGFTAPEHKPPFYENAPATPFRLKHLKMVIDTLDEVKGLGRNRVARDKALISLAWHSLLRRDEIANLRIEKLKFVDGGLFITLVKTKTGAITKTIPYSNDQRYCPVRLLQAWLLCMGEPDKGWVFLAVSKMDAIKSERTKRISGIDVQRILVRASKLAGIDETFSGHSTRRGAATDIYEAKKDPLAVKRAGNWKSEVYQDYIDEESTEKFENAGISGLT